MAVVSVVVKERERKRRRAVRLKLKSGEGKKKNENKETHKVTPSHPPLPPDPPLPTARNRWHTPQRFVLGGGNGVSRSRPMLREVLLVTGLSKVVRVKKPSTPPIKINKSPSQKRYTRHNQETDLKKTTARLFCKRCGGVVCVKMVFGRRRKKKVKNNAIKSKAAHTSAPTNLTPTTAHQPPETSRSAPTRTRHHHP